MRRQQFDVVVNMSGVPVGMPEPLDRMDGAGPDREDGILLSHCRDPNRRLVMRLIMELRTTL